MSSDRPEMEIIAPNPLIGGWRQYIARMSQLKTLAPFSPVLLDFVDAVSNAILLDPAMRAFPELMALGYWMRRPRIRELQGAFETSQGSRTWLPRGIVLHFAPANVDSIFVYSWFVSLLVGNANLVRLSTRRGDQLRPLEKKLNDVLASPEFVAIAERTLIVCYDHDDAVTELLSSQCHVRVIWGGDATVRAIRSVPLSPLALEIAFADRFSFAVLDSATVASLSDDTLYKLAQKFYMDAFWFDQMACSSPRLIIWVGNRDTMMAKQRFWAAVKRCLDERATSYAAVIGITRMATAYRYAAEGIVDRIDTPPTSIPSRCHLSADALDFREQHCGGGLFLEREVGNLDEILTILSDKDQTMSHFGFGLSDIQDFARRLPLRAVDRIVPIGTALQFAPVWDGVNLLQMFTREVTIEV